MNRDTYNLIKSVYQDISKWKESMTNHENLEIVWVPGLSGGGWYEVRGLPNGGYWTFEPFEADTDPAYIDNAIAAWTAWRAFVVSEGFESD